MLNIEILCRIHVLLHDLLQIREEIQEADLDRSVQSVLRAYSTIFLKLSVKDETIRFYKRRMPTRSVSLPNLSQLAMYNSLCNGDCDIANDFDDDEGTTEILTNFYFQFWSKTICIISI